VELLEDRTLLTAGAFLQGSAWVDANANHVLDSNEAYLPGATINLNQGATLLATTTTDSHGAYLFNDTNVSGGLNFGTSYTLVETPPPGYSLNGTQILSQINTASPGNANTIQVTIADPSNLYLTFNGIQFFARDAFDFVSESFVYSNAGVTNGSKVVSLGNTGVMKVGDQVTVKAGATTLTTTITSITPNVSITLTNAWSGSPSNSATVTDNNSESAGQLPVIPGFGSFTQQATGATVTNGSAVVSNLSSTSGYSAGQIVKVTQGSQTLYSTIASKATHSITLVDKWTGTSGTTATVSSLTTGNSFLALCWDLQHFLGNATSSQPGSNFFQVTPTPGQGSPLNAGQIAYLVNHYGTVDIKTLSGTNPSTGLPQGTPAQAVGLQVALWELEYGITFTNLQVLQLAPGNSNNAATELSQINTWANFYRNDSVGKSETATFLQVAGNNFLQYGWQGMIATGSYNFGNLAKASPTITTTPGGTVIIGSGAKLTDQATLSGTYNGTGSITFTLYDASNNVVDSETANVSGDGTYSTPSGYLPTATGTYQWVASYSGDANNNGATGKKGDEPEGLSPASPKITTNPGGTVIIGSGAKLTDQATLSGTYNGTGSITFTLYDAGNNSVDTETVSVSGDGTYTTPSGYLPTATGTYQWVASYSGDANNNGASGKKGDEPEAVNPASPTIVTTASLDISLGTTAPTITDQIVMSGAYFPTGNIVVTLDTPTGTVAIDSFAAANGTVTESYTLPTTGTVTGTYTWHVSYVGDGNNNSTDDTVTGTSQETTKVSPASPTIVTTASLDISLGTTAPTITDKIVMSGAYFPTGNIVVTLDTPTGTVAIDSFAAANGTVTESYTLPTTGTVTGTYTWHVSYAADGNNNSTDDTVTGTSQETTKVSPASPTIVTTASSDISLGTTAPTITDKIVMSGAYFPTGNIIVTLKLGNTTVKTDSFAAANGTVTESYTLPTTGTVTGTYTWHVSYAGDGNNNGTDDTVTGTSQETTKVSPASPMISTAPGHISITTGTGTFATIGFWHNKNGQAVITNLDGSPGSILLGNSLASNYPHLFGAANPYTGTSLAGLTNTQVAAVYLGLWTPSGLQKNTYVQAFAVALGLYAGGGAGTFNVGSNGALFGVQNNTTLNVTQILQTADSNFNPTTGLFYAGDQTNTSAINTILDGINTSGETPGGSTVVSSSTKLTDSATLSGGYNPTGKITFTLFDPNNVVVDAETVTVSGNGTYATPNGYVPLTTGTYQWVAAYNGDGNNNTVSGKFGDEPEVVGTQNPAIITTVPTPMAVTLSSSAVTLKDTATLQDGVNPTGKITFTLYLASTLVDTETVSVNGNGNYTTPGYTLPTTGNVTGTYQWNAVYSGDANNASDSDINNPAERVVVSAANPKFSTGPGGTVTLGSGAKLTDSATLSGAYNPTGSITFKLYDPSNALVDTETATATGNGTYSTPSGYVPLTTGTYQWVASYAGDGNNNAVSGKFGDEPESVVGPGLSITKTADAATVTSGSGIGFTIVVSNNGPASAFNVNVTDPLPTPSGVSWATVTTTAGYPAATLSNNQVTDNLGTLASGAVVTFHVTGTTAAGFSGTLNNTATVTSSNNNPSSLNASASITVNVTTKKIGAGDFATIGFWHNKNGQALIQSFNGSASSTALAQWLATTFPNLYGVNAGVHSMVASYNPKTGVTTYLTNAQVAAAYNTYFFTTGTGAKTDAQVIAAAFAIYGTSTTLAGSSAATLAQKDGFNVSAGGTGSDGYNVGSNGAAYGVANNTTLSVFQLLQATNNNTNPSTGAILNPGPVNTDFSNINQAGDVTLVVNGAEVSGAQVPLLTSFADLKTGTLLVYVDNSLGNVTADEQAGIDTAIGTLNTDLAPYGLNLVDNSADPHGAATADITIVMSDTSDIGGQPEGVLGVTEMAGMITLIDTWNFYFGSDATQVGSDQYDFQTVATHELGHAIGLGHSQDGASVMYPYLSPGDARHDLTGQDLGIIDTDAGTAPEPLLARPVSANGHAVIVSTPIVATLPTAGARMAAASEGGALSMPVENHFSFATLAIGGDANIGAGAGSGSTPTSISSNLPVGNGSIQGYVATPGAVSQSQTGTGITIMPDGGDDSELNDGKEMVLRSLGTSGDNLGRWLASDFHSGAYEQAIDAVLAQWFGTTGAARPTEGVAVNGYARMVGHEPVVTRTAEGGSQAVATPWREDRSSDWFIFGDDANNSGADSAVGDDGASAEGDREDTSLAI
jgi:hypothetical protein